MTQSWLMRGKQQSDTVFLRSLLAFWYRCRPFPSTVLYELCLNQSQQLTSLLFMWKKILLVYLSHCQSSFIFLRGEVSVLVPTFASKINQSHLFARTWGSKFPNVLMALKEKMICFLGYIKLPARDVS